MKLAAMFRNVHEKPKTPTEKKESIMLKEAKARYFVRETAGRCMILMTSNNQP